MIHDVDDDDDDAMGPRTTTRGVERYATEIRDRSGDRGARASIGRDARASACSSASEGETGGRITWTRVVTVSGIARDDDDDDDDDGCPRSTTDRSVRWRGCSRMEFVEGGGEES